MSKPILLSDGAGKLFGLGDDNTVLGLGFIADIPHLTLTVADLTHDEDGEPTAVTLEGTTLANVEVTITLDDTTLGSVTSDDNGYFTYDVSSDVVAVGTYTASITVDDETITASAVVSEAKDEHPFLEYYITVMASGVRNNIGQLINNQLNLLSTYAILKQQGKLDVLKAYVMENTTGAFSKSNFLRQLSTISLISPDLAKELCALYDELTDSDTEDTVCTTINKHRHLSPQERMAIYMRIRDRYTTNLN